jgi:1-acyl-sn-glycerol-3-phosphate acyltransferase
MHELTDTSLACGVLITLTAGAVLIVWADCVSSGYRPRVYLAFRVLWLFCKLGHGVRPSSRDPLPASGPAIVISNHTSAADPLFLQCATRRLISFLMAREYFDIKPLRPIFRLTDTILVNRTGRDTVAVRATLRAIRNGRVVGIFPEGGISLRRDALGAGKPGTAMLALLTRATVIPAFIDRRVHTNKLTTSLLQSARARVCFGPPIDLRRFYERNPDDALLDEVTRVMMDAIARLRPPEGTYNLPRHHGRERPRCHARQ